MPILSPISPTFSNPLLIMLPSPDESSVVGFSQKGNLKFQRSKVRRIFYKDLFVTIFDASLIVYHLVFLYDIEHPLTLRLGY